MNHDRSEYWSGEAERILRSSLYDCSREVYLKKSSYKKREIQIRL